LQIPIFPVVKKDLTFIHLGNDSEVDSLVNFEKLRMIAKEIRHVANMCSARYVRFCFYILCIIVIVIIIINNTRRRRRTTTTYIFVC
jgi:hypothetical protein